MKTVTLLYILNATLLVLHELESAYEKESIQLIDIKCNYIFQYFVGDWIIAFIGKGLCLIPHMRDRAKPCPFVYSTACKSFIESSR